MRIAWLAPYPAQLLEPTLRVSRKVGSYHTCSWIVTLSQALSQINDIELHLLTENHLVPHSQTVTLNNIKFHVLKSGVPFTNRRFPPYLPLDALSGFYFDVRRLIKKLDEIDPDLVHGHGTEGPYALAATRSKRPCVVSLQGLIGEIFKVSPSFYFRLVRRTERNAVRCCRYFTCRTESDRGFVIATNPQAQIFDIHEAMAPVFFENDWRVDDSCSVLYVGHLLPQKGVEVLLQALAAVKKRMPQVLLRLIGAGDKMYTRYLKDLAVQLDISHNVEFLGFLPPGQVAKFHMASQLLVLPSEMENSPNSLAEAMVSGLPVLATTVGGIPSMVNDGSTGLLVPPRNPGALADKILWLLAHGEERKRLGDAARQVARERHLPEKVATQTFAAYKEILQSIGEKP
jgi:glycosyltransferase involved in cell wall biosynthesis